MFVGVRAAFCITIRAVAVAVILGSPALALACTLIAVPKADGAQHKIYFTKFLKEDNSSGKFKKCRIVTKAEAGTQTFFVTPFRQDASVVVHKDNWP